MLPRGSTAVSECFAAPAHGSVAYPPGLVAVREAAFDQGAFALPVAPSFLLLLRNVAAHLITLHPLHHRATVVALVRHQFFDPLQVHLRFVLGPQIGLPSDLFGDLLTRLA